MGGLEQNKHLTPSLARSTKLTENGNKIEATSRIELTGAQARGVGMRLGSPHLGCLEELGFDGNSGGATVWWDGESGEGAG